MFGPDIVKLWVWHRNLTQLLVQGRRQLSSHWRRAGPALPVTTDRGKLTPDSDIRFWCCYSLEAQCENLTLFLSRHLPCRIYRQQQRITLHYPLTWWLTLSLSSQYWPYSLPMASTPLFSRFSNLFSPSPSMLSWSVCFLSYSLPSVLEFSLQHWIRWVLFPAPGNKIFLWMEAGFQSSPSMRILEEFPLLRSIFY